MALVAPTAGLVDRLLGGPNLTEEQHDNAEKIGVESFASAVGERVAFELDGAPPLQNGMNQAKFDERFELTTAQSDDVEVLVQEIVAGTKRLESVRNVLSLGEARDRRSSFNGLSNRFYIRTKVEARLGLTT